MDVLIFRDTFSKLTIGVVSMKQLKPEPSHASDWLALVLAILVKLVRYFLRLLVAFWLKVWIETLSRDAEGRWVASSLRGRLNSKSFDKKVLDLF
jgi:hypothetical protein